MNLPSLETMVVIAAAVAAINVGLLIYSARFRQTIKMRLALGAVTTVICCVYLFCSVSWSLESPHVSIGSGANMFSRMLYFYATENNGRRAKAVSDLTSHVHLEYLVECPYCAQQRKRVAVLIGSAAAALLVIAAVSLCGMAQNNVSWRNVAVSLLFGFVLLTAAPKLSPSFVPRQRDYEYSLRKDGRWFVWEPNAYHNAKSCYYIVSGNIDDPIECVNGPVPDEK